MNIYNSFKEGDIIISNNTLIFVYGTLREHEENDYLLKNAKCIQKQCWIIGTLYDTGDGYPALVINHGNKVYGELYEVNEEELKEIDVLEGYLGNDSENDYNRTEETIFFENSDVKAYAYSYTDLKVKGFKVIHCGDWKYYLYGK